MKLTYLPVRGRAEPILLLLIDSNTDFEQEIITAEDWREMKAKGETGPPRFPFNGLPTLTFGHGARGGQDTILAETGAILLFLEGKLAAPGTVQSPPDARARLEMVREASAFLLNRLFASASSSDWLAPPSRQHMLSTLILPYLTSLSHHLSSAFFPPLLTPPLTLGQPGSSLSAAAASACTVISFIEELFPNTLGAGEDGKMKRRFPLCEALRVEVESRPRIKAWIEGGGRGVRWTLWEHGSTEWIKQEAEKYDVEDRAVFGDGKGATVAEAGREAEMDTGV
ncbi:hypothetical protein BCR35DRAFT_303345 [Leucosporidium creatinivorum]|uniref:GST N-terminal domain-containing protein n=1 Tax=Leucosporidium creatinivorum TaxID=106004 RepID=A0A1Y2FJT8_9BASI|nr:hypothetical protein BCR35DRAFT_303345 [Leucosporidium creatinivorum]